MEASAFVSEIIDRHIKNEGLKRLLISHSRMVGLKALETARECGLDGEIDRQFLFDAAMLHDIGVVECDAPGIHCFGSRPYICHGIEGAELLRKEGIGEKYQRVCERHTGSGLTADEVREHGLPLPVRDYLPETLEEKLICYADKFYSKSRDPLAEKSMERVEASMARHGEGALKRFRELHRLFTPTKQ